MAEFLVARTVSLSLELERADRAHLLRLTSAIENSDDAEICAVETLAKLLFADPAGHTSLYGITPENRTKLKKTSGNGVPDPNDPGVLLRTLESSEMGCTFLRSVWQELRAQVDGTAGKFWQSLDRLKIFRLMGYQPVQANEHRRIAEIFVASNALKPSRKTEFDDLLSDMTTSQHERYVKTVWERWPDLKIAKEPAKAREILIDLCDEHIEELTEKLEEYAENADANVERTVTSLGLDQSREGNNVRAYLQKCSNGFYRGVEALQRYQGKKSKDQGGRGYQGEPRRIEEAGLRTDDRRRRIDDAGLLAPDTAWATLPVADSCQLSVVSGPLQMRNADAGVDSHDESAADAVDRAATADCGGTSPTSGEDMRDGQLSVVSCPLQMPNADAVPDRGAQPDCGTGTASGTQSDGMSWQGENSENVTNEPKFDENVIIAKTQEIVGVVANSGVDTGLDSSCQGSVSIGQFEFVSGQLSVVSCKEGTPWRRASLTTASGLGPKLPAAGTAPGYGPPPPLG